VGAAVVSRIAIGAVAACALAACATPDYQCRSDRDCDVGTVGRCEIDHRCTAIDPTCPTHRRYADHSGPRSNTCFDDQLAPIDRCAAGQPPALAEGCLAEVCQAVPGCCTTGWSEACVQQAQILCSDLVCDTRIAITANKPGRTELWDLRWDGSGWTAQLDGRQSVLAWLAPAPGDGAPRLAGFTGNTFTTDGLTIPVAASRSYLEATSVDFDRDGRPTAVLGYTDAGNPHLTVTKLDDGTSREVASAAATRLSWGDVDHDAFPDGIAAAGTSTRYHLLSNIEADDHLRAIDDRVMTNVAGGSSGNPPPVRGFDWVDIDGDHLLDVVAYGYTIDVHLGKGDAIGTTVLIRIDCDPPSAASACDVTEQADQAFAGAALPAPTGAALVIATHPQRALYRAELRGTPTATVLSPYTFPAEVCGNACAPIVAVVVRDLDGDHALDVIAIDADLQVYTGLAKDHGVLRTAIKLPTTPAAPGFLAVRTSVTGAPR
jgi:hypothetical protein